MSMLYANSLFIREHRDIILREYMLARDIYEKLLVARRFASLEDAGDLSRLLKQAEKMCQYYYEMSGLMQRMDSELGSLSHTIGVMLEDSKHWTNPFEL